jgi:hypothetical protein
MKLEFSRKLNGRTEHEEDLPSSAQDRDSWFDLVQMSDFVMFGFALVSTNGYTQLP